MNEQLFSFAHYADQLVLMFLIGLSIISFAIIAERTIYLRSIHKDATQILRKIEAALGEKNLQEISHLVEAKNSLFTPTALYTVHHIEQFGDKGLEEIFNTFSLTLRPKLERFLSFLGTIGSNAPYVGLLGTVLGIMKAFHDMTHSTSEAGQKAVMAGISMALVATAAGLAVAIPSVAFYNYFNKKVQSIFDTLSGLKEISLAYAKSLGEKK